MSNENLPVVAGAVDNAMSELSGSRNSFMSSFKADTPEGKIKLYNATAEAVPLNEHLDKVIQWVDFVAQIVTFTDEEDVQQEGIRVILLDADGNGYAALSQGILSSVKNLVGIFGEPSTWTAPLPIKVVEERGRKNFRFMTIKLATDEGKRAASK